MNETEWMKVVQTWLEGGMYKYFVYNTHVTPLQKIFSRPQEHLAKIFSVQIFRIKHVSLIAKLIHANHVHKYLVSIIVTSPPGKIFT